jgi:hypothetical protein
MDHAVHPGPERGVAPIGRPKITQNLVDAVERGRSEIRDSDPCTRCLQMADDGASDEPGTSGDQYVLAGQICHHTS